MCLMIILCQTKVIRAQMDQDPVELENSPPPSPLPKKEVEIGGNQHIPNYFVTRIIRVGSNGRKLK